MNNKRFLNLLQVEYSIIPENGDRKPVHVQKANIPLEKGGYLIYGVAHQHGGSAGSTLYGQDGRILCNSRPRYGTGKEAGNEKGYLVAMSECLPKPGSVKIHDNEILTLESRYNNTYLTGLMGHFYIFVAEKLQQ
ncbi:putative stress up-regulated Nod 19 [Lupinus albus]|uniref:Putative stress up-regulated Nod 19 n=1 Tax=Lupinus albus TaxID=3870 RepID=A0A6A4PMS5_LUPAL|nr:putative stress up-regulated Nod 19 [Lupinus albus]